MMSVVSIHKEKRTSSGLLMHILLKYVPEEIVKAPLEKLNFGYLDFVEDDGKRLFQWMLNNSSHHLRMYGTHKELAENVKIYRNFQGCMTYIGSDIIEPYSIAPTIYKSMTNKEYIVKQDLFVHLQDLILKHFPEMEDMPILSMILIFLRTREELLKDCSEFVQYDKEEFAKLEAEIVALGSDLNKEGSAHFPKAPLYQLKLQKCNMDEIFVQWKNILPFQWDNLRFEGVQAILSSVLEEVPRREAPFFFRRIFYNLNILIQGLKKIIDKRPDWFLPYDMENPNTPEIMKLYEDYGESFALIMDVNEAIDRENNDQLEEFKMEDGSDGIWGWKTISYDELKRRFPEQCETIEFIQTPVIRAKHRAVPLMNIDGDPFLFASDALLELLRRMILTAKLFQRVKKDTRVLPRVKEFLESHYDKFGTSHTIFVLELDHIEEINQEFNAIFQKYLEDELESVPLVRNVKKDGFTVDNLRNELKYLCLTDVFPNITDYSEIVYEHVFKRKTAKVLRTCDLFDAVELCQLICIFKMFPRLADFLHSQKCCHRILVECSVCVREAAEEKSKQAILENLANMKTTGSAGKVKAPREVLKEKLSDVESENVTLKRAMKVAAEEEKKQRAAMEQSRLKEVEQLKMQIEKVKQEAAQIRESTQSQQSSSDKCIAQLADDKLKLEKQVERENKIGERFQQELKKQQELKGSFLKKLATTNESIKSGQHNKNSGAEKELRKKNMRLKIRLEEKEKTIENLLRELN